MAVLRLSWMMTPRWQGLRVTPRLRVRSLRLKAEIVRQEWAFCRSGAQVDTRLVPLSLAVTSFVVGCCGLLDSLWCGCVGLHSARPRRLPHVHDCAAERVAPHTRRRLREHAQTVYDQTEVVRVSSCCVTQLCLHPAGADKSACFRVNWMENLDSVSNIVPPVFTCVRRGTPSLGSCQRFPLSSLLSPLSLARVLRNVTRWRQLRATHSPISYTRESPEPG